MRPGAGQRAGHVEVGLDGDGDPEPREHAPVERAEPFGLAQDDGDLARRDSPSSSRPAIARADGLGLGQLAGGGQQLDARRRWATGSPRSSGGSPKRRSTSNSERLAVNSGSASRCSSTSRPRSRAARRTGAPRASVSTVAVLPGQGDRDVGGAEQRPQQVELLDGQVVEPVEEDGPGAPGVRALAAAPRSPRPRACGSPRGRARRGPRSRPRRGGRPRPRRGRPRRRAGREGRGVDAGRLQVGDQLVERRLRSRRCAEDAARSFSPPARRDRLARDPRALDRASAAGATRTSVACATSENSRSNVQTVAPTTGPTRPRQFALEPLGVVERGHDQHGVARRSRPGSRR